MEQLRSSRWFAAIITVGVVSLLSIQCRERRASYRAVEPPRPSAEENERGMVLAFEAADRAWRAEPSPATAGLRERAAEQLLLSGAAAPSVDFLKRELASAPRLRGNQRQRFEDALRSFTRGREAFETEAFDRALEDFKAAEAEWSALDVPQALLARELRIRSECSKNDPRCLEKIRAFRAELAASGRHPWLEARAAYAEGQTLLLQSRMYEAVQVLQHAQREFRRLGDRGAEGCMDTTLASAFAAAGETDFALSHHLAAIRNRSGHSTNKRRGQLEEAMMFLLRHGHLASAEAVLEELHALPATPAAQVMESILRGVLYMRRGDRDRGAFNFDRAHALLGAVEDKATHSHMAMMLAITEAGSRADSPHPVLEQIEAAIARHEGADETIWLPQLLAERGVALERRADDAGAERDYRRAMDLLEEREPRVDQMLIGIGAAADSESPFDRAIRLLLRQERSDEALAVAQRAAALRVSALYAPAAGLPDVFRNARSVDGRAAVAEMRRRLAPGHAAVAFHLLRDELITWVITPEKVFTTQRRVDAAAAVRRADALRECGRRSCTDAAIIESVSNLLLRDWIEHVPPETTLMMQPPPELQGVPFSMLRTRRGEPLLLRNGSTTAPALGAFLRAEDSDARRAASTGAYFAAAPQPGGALASLPRARREVIRASRSYDGAFVDRGATRSGFLSRAAAYAMVHFAGHVLVNEEQPLYSALAFESSGLLYMHELTETAFANTRTAVLSACETGRAPRPTMSVANALLAHNVPAVVYTLWPVSDEDAEEFAVEFHAQIAKGVSRAEAVRKAQRRLMQRNPERSEAWATFALAGTPGPHGKVLTRVALMEVEGTRKWDSE